MWQNTTAQDRLDLWRTLRDDIKDLDIDTQLEKIAKLFSTTPIGVRSLDFYSPDTWPSPWEILYHGTFCTSSISLLIYYTLQMDNPKHDIKLCLIDDKTDRYLLPVFNDHYVLNYELGAISNWHELKTKFKVIEVFQDKHIYQVI